MKSHSWLMHGRNSCIPTAILFSCSLAIATYHLQCAFTRAGISVCQACMAYIVCLLETCLAMFNLRFHTKKGGCALLRPKTTTSC